MAENTAQWLELRFVMNRFGQKTLIGNFCSAISKLCVPAKAGRPLQRGVASAAGGCRDAVVNTGSAAGRVGIVDNVQARPLPIG